MAKKLRLSNKTIDRVINSLKQEKRLKRTGNNNSGYWDILQNGVKLFHYDPQEERKETILTLIDENNRIIIAELSKKMKLNRATIGEIIAILKHEKQIERIGNSRNGQWVILKSGVIPSHYASPEERKETVLALIDENPYITRAEMAKSIGVSTFTIDNATSFLRQEGRLERRGNKRTGIWEILK